MISTNEIICITCKCLMKKMVSGKTVSCESMGGHQACDYWECPKCGFELLTGFSAERGPFDSRYERLDYYFPKLK